MSKIDDKMEAEMSDLHELVIGDDAIECWHAIPLLHNSLTTTFRATKTIWDKINKLKAKLDIVLPLKSFIPVLHIAF